MEEEMSKLTAEQIAAAQGLLENRPPVLPGTRVILDDAARKQWYDNVTATMERLGLDQDDVNQFCDLAGVPD
jgi:hypothetical protein